MSGHAVIQFFSEMLAYNNDVFIPFHLQVEMIETFFAGGHVLVLEFVLAGAGGQRPQRRLHEAKCIGGVALLDAFLECGVENL